MNINHMTIEARCLMDGETFIPDSAKPDDLIHYVDSMGAPCMGRGIIVGAWSSTPARLEPCEMTLQGMPHPAHSWVWWDGEVCNCEGVEGL